MMGRRPIAVMESGKRGSRPQMLRIGETLMGFELMEVRSGSVVLEKQGVRVVLEL